MTRRADLNKAQQPHPPPPPAEKLLDEPGFFASVFYRFVYVLGVIGRTTRLHGRFFLMLVGAGWGVFCESVRPLTWRRTIFIELGKTLRQVVIGGLASTLFTALLAGVAVVSQAVYWLGAAGLTKMTGSLLVTVLVREITPVLVGFILLGRSGMLTVVECSVLTLNGQMRSLEAFGLDPFLLYVVPRTWAFTIGSFTLSVIFAATSLVIGYIVVYQMGVVTSSLWGFLDDVLLSMSGWDYVAIPLKSIFVGFAIGLESCLTGLAAQTNDTVSTLMPRGFARGILMVMVVTVLFSLGG